MEESNPTAEQALIQGNSRSARENLLSKEELLSCMELGKTITAELGAKRLFGKILDKVSQLLPAENWSLLLADEETGELRFEVSVGLDKDLIKDIRLRAGEGVAGQVVLQQKPMIVPNVRQCPFFSDKVDRVSGCRTHAIISVPLLFGGKALGVIEVINPGGVHERALALLSIVGEYAAIAVENMRRYNEIQDLAIHDNLTGLYNTRHLYKALKDLLSESERAQSPLSLIFMDMDNFKRVVDTYGHLKGSQALQEVAGTIRGCLVNPAFGVAYGGDEFVVVLPGYKKEQAIEKAEDIRSKMQETSYLSDHGHAVTLSASFGLATYPGDATELKGLLALADKAMFHVKKTGKDAIEAA
jgi:diguanylate cyclase (GGDEF)-like protein